MRSSIGLQNARMLSIHYVVQLHQSQCLCRTIRSCLLALTAMLQKSELVPCSFIQCRTDRDVQLLSLRRRYLALSETTRLSRRRLTPLFSLFVNFTVTFSEENLHWLPTISHCLQ